MDTDNLISIAEAAKLKGVTLQAIRYAVKTGKIKMVGEMFGRRLLDRQEVDAYTPRAKTKKKGETGTP